MDSIRTEQVSDTGKKERWVNEYFCKEPMVGVILCMGLPISSHGIPDATERFHMSNVCEREVWTYITTKLCFI